jgi:hypothetical protein
MAMRQYANLERSGGVDHSDPQWSHLPGKTIFTAMSFIRAAYYKQFDLPIHFHHH